MKKKYYRHFFTLTQERSGYNQNGEALGRIVLEAKEGIAKASVYIQNLLPKHIYKLMLIFKKEDTHIGVDIDQIMVSEKGRYDEKIEFAAYNIQSSGFSVDEVYACAITLQSSSEIIAPLVGYKLSAFSWKLNFKKFENKPQEKQEEVKKEVAKVKEEQEVTKAEQEEIIEKEEAIEATQEEDVLPIKEGIKIKEDDIKSDIKNQSINQIFETEAAVDIFEEMHPKVHWVATTLNTLYNIKAAEHICESTFVSACFEKYRHVLLGKTKSNGDYIYIVGIPDVYMSDIAKKQQMNFDSFKCVRTHEATDGAHGYWLAILKT